MRKMLHTIINRTDFYKKTDGFIALISVIVMVLILLGVTASLATTGFLNRFNILEGEAKRISAGLAAGCAESARLKIARDPAYAGGEKLSIDEQSCTIVSVTHGGGESTIQSSATYRQATTNLEVVVDGEENILSWQEVSDL